MLRCSLLFLVLSLTVADKLAHFTKPSGYNELKELERQNRITQQIFANFIERRLFPNRRGLQKAPTIDDILPTTTETSTNQKYPIRRARYKQSIPIRNNQDDLIEFNGSEDILDDIEGDGLQSVESNQFDNFLENENYITSSKISDCPNCVDEAHFTNKWTMPLLKLGEKRYYLGIFFRANWFKAGQYCRFHGMHLASISSQEENDRLEKHIREFGLGHEHFWISGTDLAEEGNFFWMANGRPITFTNWNAGEPNNFRYENGEEENCLELWNRDGKGLKWNDSPCSFETYFVCEVQ